MRIYMERTVTYIWNYGAVSYNLNSLDVTSETKGIKLKLNSEVNGEVELVFDIVAADDNTKDIRNLDLSKMRLK